MNIKKISIAVLLIGFLHVTGMSHGVSYQTINGGVGLQVFYDDHSPISFSEFKVYSPLDRETVYQEGLTDKHGRFLFIPDQGGKWKVSVSDGLGHGVVTEIEVDAERLVVADHGGGLSRWQKILMGICFIFGITGVLFFFSARKYQTKK